MPRPQFTLRTLLVATLVVSTLAGLAAEKARRRQSAVAELESKGCGFVYSDDPFLPPIEEPPPDWMTKVFGRDRYPSPLQIIVEGASVTDDDVEVIAAITSLWFIEIVDASFTDAGVARLKRLRPDCYVYDVRK